MARLAEEVEKNRWRGTPLDPEVPRGGLLLAGLALGGYFGYLGLTWIAGVASQAGTGVVEQLVGGSGGGGGLCGTLPSWFCSDTRPYLNPDDASGGLLPQGGLAAVLSLLLFVGFLLFLLYLCLRLPVTAKWSNHAWFFPRVKWSPPVVIGVVAISNSDLLRSALADLLEDPRTFSAYSASLAAFFYWLVFRWTAPLDAMKLATSPGAEAPTSEMDNARPMVRALLSILAYLFVIQSLFLLLTLIPNALSLYGADHPWYRVFWPFLD